MMLIALIGFVASERASATTLAAPCCDYVTVDIDCTIPDACFPFKIDTYWNNGAVVTSPAFFGCGSYTFSVVPPLPPCYAVANNFKYLTINGTPTIVPFNQPTKVQIGGCCYLVLAYADPATGCLRIRIGRC